MSLSTSSPATAPIAPPPAPDPVQPADAAAPSADAPPEGAEPVQEPTPADLAAEVMRRREAGSLAKLMREKRELDERAAAFKDAEPKLATLSKAQQLWESGDYSGALHAFAGLAAADPGKVKEQLPRLYEQLTSQILGVDSPTQVQASLQRDVASLQRKLEELQQEKARREAEHEQWTAQDRERRVQGAVESIATLLSQNEQDVPYLLAEADDPAQVVWDIMLEAVERGDKPLEPEEAAKIANQYFQPIFEKKKNRYQYLLAPQGASGSIQPEATPSQTAPSKSLTNADASRAPDLQTPRPIPNREDSIDAAWKLLQERHRQT